MKKIYNLAITAFFLIALVGNVKATDYYLKQGSASISQPSSWGTTVAGNGVGDSPANFNGTHTWHFTNRAGANYNLSPAFSIPAAATMSIHSAFSLTVAGSGAFTNAFAIDIASGGSLTISKSTNLHFNNLDVNSTVIFNSANYPIRMSSNYQNPLQYGNIVIATSNSISGTGVDIFVNGLLTIDANQTFNIAGNNIYLAGSAGSIAGAGNINTDAASIISVSGGSGGNNGTLNFANTVNPLNQLVMSYNTGGDLITLGADVSIQNGFFAQFAGSLDLNGHSLSTDAGTDASFPGNSSLGAIVGDPASSLIFEGTIGGGTGNSILFIDGSSNNLASLVLNSAGNTLVLGSALVINDSLSVSDGTFDTGNMVTINGASAAGQMRARIGMILGGGSITNDVTVETLISGGNTGWMNLGAPGVSGETISDWDNYPTNGVPMACTGCSEPPMGTFVSVQTWNEASGSYAAMTSASALSPGSGHWVYVGDGASTTNNLTLVNTGPAVQGPVTVPLTASGGAPNTGYNLVANPYASPISWTKLKALNPSGSISGDVQAWTPQANNYGVYTAGAGSGTNGMSDIIPAGQGFYVQTSAAITFTFDETVKTSGNTTDLMRNSNMASTDELLLSLNGQWSRDETMFRFRNGATANFENQLDAQKRFSSAGYYGTGNSYSKYTTISSKDASGQDYAINTMGPLTNSMTIPVLARVNYAGTYTISAKDAGSFGSCLILKDKLTGAIHDLKTSPYAFTISDTTSAPRFELMFCQTEIGPVAVNELKAENPVTISQDLEGAFVRTSFPANTKAVISAYNIIGQEVMKDVVVTGTESMTRLNLNVHDQVVVIRVTTDKESVVKKIVIR